MGFKTPKGLTSPKPPIVLAVRHKLDSFYPENHLSEKTVNEQPAKPVSLGQWIKLVVVYLLIPLILLICGGDIGWWQAWLYCILILGAGIGGRMWAEHRHPGLTAARQNIEVIQSAKAWDKALAPLMAVSI